MKIDFLIKKILRANVTERVRFGFSKSFTRTVYLWLPQQYFSTLFSVLSLGCKCLYILQQLRGDRVLYKCFNRLLFDAQPATGAFVLCRRTDNTASASPRYHLQFRPDVINWAVELTMNFYIFIRHLYRAGRFSNSATNTNA